MAENINISFAPNKSASESQRIADLEQYVSTLTERTKFAFASIIEEYNGADTDKTQQILNTIYQSTSESGSDVGKFTNTDKNCEVFNDYENNVAGAYYSHAEGYKTTANAPYSHAEGRETVAYNMHSHAEGYKTVAGGQSSHAEGEDCRATGSYAHAEGHKTVASGTGSHASGWGTVAGDMTFAIGRWNKTSDGLFVVGNGWSYGSDESDASRSDALVLDGSGNLHIAGKLTADGGVEYSMPTATRYTLGGVVIGDNISVTADGTISVDLSAYLKSADISEWAKQSDKPTYTANEIGLGNVDNTADADKPISTATQTALDGKADTGHTHTVSDITDMPAYLTEETDPTVPAWAKAESKPVYTAEEVGAVTAEDMDAKTYLKAVDITGQTVDLNDYKLNQPADKGKSVRHFCSVASSENITNRPVSVNEPFELVTTNIRYVSTGAYHTVQKYTSATRQRTYTRWCANGTWSAWKCDTDVVVYGSVTADSPKTFAYATYGEGFGVVEIEAYYDNATNPVRNRKVFALSPTASIERVMLTISNGSSESVTLANGSITMSMTGTTALSFMIRYTNSR